MSQNKPYRITLFGTLCLYKGERSFHVQQGKELFLYLACHSERVLTRYQIAEALGGVNLQDISVEALQSRLRGKLAQLKKFLERGEVGCGEILCDTKQTISFDTQKVSCDYADALRMIAEIRKGTPLQAEYIERLRRWRRAGLLTGVNEVWAEGIREGFRREALTLLRGLARASEATGEIEEAIEMASVSLEFSETDYEMELLILNSLAKKGDTYDLMAKHREFEIRYKQAGDKPIPVAFRELHEKTRRELGSQTKAPKGRFSPLPIRKPGEILSPHSRIYGREAEIKALTELIEGSKHRLITLRGIGGIGKTRLAQEWLKVRETQWEDRRYWIDAKDCLSAASLESKIARAILSQPPKNESKRYQLRKALENTPTVVVLDNLEQIIEPAKALIEGLLQENAILTLLTTSRLPLKISGERILPVSRLSCEEACEKEDGSLHSDALKLFFEHAQAKNPDFTPTRDRIRSVSKLCRYLDGIPMFLIAVAENMASSSPEEIRKKIEEHGELPQNLDSHRSNHERKGLSVVKWQLSLLTPELLSLVLKLCLFRGSFTAEAAEAICEDGEIYQSLRVLEEMSLIYVRAGTSPIRFEMMESFREAGMQLLDLDSKRTALEKHSIYYAQKLQSLDDAKVSELDKIYKQLLLDDDQYRLAWNTAKTGFGPEALARFVLSFNTYLNQQLEWNEGVECLEFVLNETVVFRGLHVRILRELGVLTQLLDRKAQSSEIKQLAYDMAIAHENTYEINACQLSLGHSALTRSQYPEAIEIIEAALEHPEIHKYGELLAAGYHTLGGVALLQNRHSDACDLFRSAIREWNRVGNASKATFSRLNLASSFATIDISHGMTLFGQVMDEFEKQNNFFGMALTWIAHGNFAIREGRFEDAEAWLSRAEETFERLDVSVHEGIACFHLGELWLKTDQLSRAEENFRKSLSLFRHGGELRRVLSCLEGVARLRLAQRDGAEAVWMMAACASAYSYLKSERFTGEMGSFDSFCAESRALLGESDFEIHWNRGLACSSEFLLESYSF